MNIEPHPITNVALGEVGLPHVHVTPIEHLRFWAFNEAVIAGLAADSSDVHRRLRGSGRLPLTLALALA